MQSSSKDGWRFGIGPTSHPTAWLVAATVVGGLLRLASLPWAEVITPDGVYYVECARGLLRGDLWNGLSPYWPPVYPLAIAIVSPLFPDIELAGRFVAILFSTATIPLTYLLVRDSYGGRGAQLAAWIVALYPQLIWPSSSVLADSTYGFLLLLALHLGWRALNGERPRTALGAALAFGAAYLTRPEGVGFALLYVGLIPLAAWLRGWDRRRLGRQLAFTLAGLMLTAAPYVVYMRAHTGHWMVSEKFAAHVGNPDLDWFTLLPGGEATLADVYYGGAHVEGASWEASRPDDAGGDVAAAEGAPATEDAGDSDDWRGVGFLRKVHGSLQFHYDYILPALIPLWLALLMVPAWVLSLWDRKRLARELYLTLFVGCTVAGYVVTWAEVRYYHSILPILIGWSAFGGVEVMRWFRGTWDRCGFGWPVVRRYAAWLVPLSLIVVLIPSLLRPLRQPPQARRVEERAMGRWIAAQGPSMPVVLSNSPVVAYYAGAHHWYLPDEPVERLMAYAHRRDADYIVVQGDKVNRHRLEYLRPLLDPASPAPGLTPVQHFAVGTKRAIVVWHVDPEDPEPGP